MKRDQHGALNTLVIPLVLVLLILVGVSVFSVIVYQKEQKYQKHSNQLVSAAVTTAQQQQSTSDAEQYALEAKQPLRAYMGPSAYSSVVVNYPKTWSAYVDEEDGSSTPINGYFQPSFVPSTDNQNNLFALRLEVTDSSYSNVLSQFTSLAQSGQVTIKPYQAPRVPSVIGVRIDGEIEPNVQGSMIILPVRDTTLQLWTESSQFETDFNNNILPNFKFSP
ncbi:MAG TPA: hypothetical protein VMR28_01300 [Candidatus Saccharimonadales bacterium]|nr:hypothetical protein [Candidatus Saccharimonadales bacterium]